MTEGIVTPGFTATDRRGYADDLRILAMLHDAEPTAFLLASLRETPVEELLHLPIVDEVGVGALEFFRKALSTDVTRTDPAGLDELAADYAAIYLTHTHRVSPAESPWIDPEGLNAQAPMFAVRDWYRHWGVEAPDWRKRPDDHLVVQLEFLAHLMTLTDSSAALTDAARFLDRHLLRWYASFAEGVTARCWTPYWAGVANLTLVYLDAMRHRLEAIPGCERAVLEPIEAEKERLSRAAVAETCASAGSFMPGVGPTL